MQDFGIHGDIVSRTDDIQEENGNDHLSWRILAPKTTRFRIVLLSVHLHYSIHKIKCSGTRGTLQEKQLSFLWQKGEEKKGQNEVRSDRLDQAHGLAITYPASRSSPGQMPLRNCVLSLQNADG